MEYMATCKDKEFDLAICDPPYGAGGDIFSFEINLKNKKTNHTIKNWNENRPDEAYFKELRRVSKNQIIWGGNYFTDNLPISRGWIFWNKRYEKMHSFSDGELAWTSFDKNLKMFTYRGELTGAIHPTQKPRKLYDWVLEHYSEKGQKVLDTHLGSGSSAIASHYFGVDFVGTEIDKEYYDKTMKRFKEETLQIKLF